MKRVAVALSAVLLLGAGSAVAGHRMHRFDATIRCRTAYLNEDQAANLKLVKFALDEDGNQVLVYRCKRHGY